MTKQERYVTCLYSLLFQQMRNNPHLFSEGLPTLVTNLILLKPLNVKRYYYPLIYDLKEYLSGDFKVFTY